MKQLTKTQVYAALEFIKGRDIKGKLTKVDLSQIKNTLAADPVNWEKLEKKTGISEAEINKYALSTKK